MPKRCIAAGVTLLLLALVGAASVAAQTRISANSAEPGQVSMRVDLPISVPVRSERQVEPAPPTPTWRSFTVLEQIRLNVHFTNESDTAVWLRWQEAREAIRFRVTSAGTAISVSTHWSPGDRQHDYIVRIQRPTTKAEEAHRHILEAEAHAARDEFTAGLNAYGVAAAANPDDQSGVVGMAHMYTNLGRFQNAVELYERAGLLELAGLRS